jgi:16S rRNA U516 pseudouridylate synthase RsuA-like enzyme
MERLNKVLAHAGVASRRGVETLILQGRVSVNGVKVTDVGAKVSTTGQDSVSVDNKPVDVKAPSGAGVQWLALNKPKGIVTSLGDDKGRKHLGDVVPQATEKRLLPVGKLDRECSGLVLLTNDHESSHLLSQPSFGLIKEYKVVVQNGLPKLAVLEALAEGGVKLKEPSPASGSGKPSAASGSGRPSPTFGSGKAASYGGTGRANRPVRSTQPMEVEVLDFFADRKETVLRVSEAGDTFSSGDTKRRGEGSLSLLSSHV